MKPESISSGRVGGELGIALLALALASACVGEESIERCDYGVTSLPLQAEDREIVGVGAAYPFDATLRERAQLLEHSQAERRQAAWQTIGKLLAPVELAREPSEVEGALPLWRSWYGSDEVERLFQHLYGDLEERARDRHDRFSQAQIDEAFGWNRDAIEDLVNWPEERRDAYLAAIDSLDKLGGIAGIGRVGYSPDAVRHILRSYPEVLRCLQEGPPRAVEQSSGPALQQALREPLSLSTCASQSFGPFFVAPGEELRASIDAPELAGAELSVYTRDGEELSFCEAKGAKPCTVTGPDTYYVRVSAGAEGLEGAVQVDYASADTPWAACLESAFPQSAVIVKADWRRAQFGSLLPTYSTSAAALGRALASDPQQGWGEGDRQSDPKADEIYTIELPNGQRYRLAALHIMTKELDHWQWITMWWSDEPETDFGEDRPEAIAALGPWRNYKMCAVSDFREGDREPGGGYENRAPTLAAALRAVYGGVGGPSWCSNPYLELGAGNMATNCIGCHQHGGDDLRAEEIIGDETLFPAHGRTQLRNNFPDDYSWALVDGDRLALAFKAAVDYFDE